MEQLKFGDILRSTRERKGLDFNETAQRLRIRPDILRAIEDSNVAAMPPRGYARNMVTGYARYLGLDPNEMSRLYIEELRIYEERRARVRARMSSEGSDSNAERSARVSSRAVSRPDDTPRPSRSSAGSTGRMSADDSRTERMERVEGQGRRTRSSQGSEKGNPLQAAAGTISNAASNIASRHRPSFNASGRGRQSRDPMLKANDYVTFFQDRGGGIESKLPFILAAAIILLVLIILGALLFGNHGKKGDDVATMPVTSVEESVQQQQEAVEQAPTKFTFAYKIDEGTEAWTEIYLDGEAQVAEILTGPTEGSYDVTGTVQFVCAAADGVHVTIDGEEQELEFDANGMVNMTYDFADYLKKWQEAHGMSGSSASSSSSSDNSSSSSETATEEQSSTTEEAAATEEQTTEEQPAEEVYYEEPVYDDGTYYDDTVYYDDGTYTEEVYY